MSLDKSLIYQKLTQLDDYIERIENMRFSENQFLENVDYQDLLTFRLFQSVEVCIEIATYIISAFNLQRPETARSSFDILAEHKIISYKLANKLSSAVSFRNLAVHGYEKFDFRQLFHDYKEDVSDLKNFIRAIFAFLEDRKKI